MNILIACEESQAVCIEFRKLGFNAFSCDILPCSGGHPEWHLQGDVSDYLYGYYECKCGNLHEETMGKYGCCGVSKLHLWDMIIAFPPCTDLAVSGAAWFERKRQSGEQQKAIEFFMKMINAPCDRVVVENPVNIIAGKYIGKYFPELTQKYGFPIKPTQIIEPYYFGDNANKKTCLWIKGVPPLQHNPENYAAGSVYKTAPSGKRYPEWCWYTGKGCSTKRSKTFPGIAKAIAQQWGEYLLNNTK